MSTIPSSRSPHGYRCPISDKQFTPADESRAATQQAYSAQLEWTHSIFHSLRLHGDKLSIGEYRRLYQEKLEAEKQEQGEQDE